MAHARPAHTARRRGVRASLAPVALAAALAALAACGDATAPATTVADAPMAARKKPRPTDPTPTPAPSPTPDSTANPLAGVTLYVDPWSNARKQADTWRSTRPADAQQMDKIAAQPQAKWFGNWNADVRAAADQWVTQAAAAGAVPVLVAYNIPNRDCGGYSSGNVMSADAYRTWIRAFADGVGTRRAVVVLEPDALALMGCLTSTDQQLRFDLLKDAVTVLAAKGGIAVYVDAGHSNWQPASTMASRLTSAGVAGAAGFALNVSNFQLTDNLVSYGTTISQQIGGKHFVLDTSRNGLGPTADNQWCNPDGRALGARPTAATGNGLVDAYLWVKAPGESDGSCNGAPAAGTWMPEYALGLAQRAAY